MHFSVEQAQGGWIVNMESTSNGVAVTKVVVKDNELIKQFKQFVEEAKPITLNEG